MFFLILFGFYHVFLTGRTAAKNNIQFQPYRSNNFAHLLMKWCVKKEQPESCSLSLMYKVLFYNLELELVLLYVYLIVLDCTRNIAFHTWEVLECSHGAFLAKVDDDMVRELDTLES